MPKDMGIEWAEELIENGNSGVAPGGETVHADEDKAGQLVKENTWG